MPPGPFDHSVPLRGEQLVVGTTLPAVHALGDITMFWPVPKPPLPARIALQLRCRLHGHPAADDYAPEPESSTKPSPFLIKLTLHPRQVTSDSTVGAKADQRRLAETVKRLSVSLEGMAVLSLKRDGSTWTAELEGTGERWVQAGERGPWRVFQEPEVDDTPAWLHSTPAPEESEPVAALPVREEPVPPTSKMTPLTDLPVPLAPKQQPKGNKKRQPPATANIETRPAKQPRLTAPQQVKSIPPRAVPPVKSASPAKADLSPEKASAVPEQAQPRTVWRLGPPGAAAQIRHEGVSAAEQPEHEHIAVATAEEVAPARPPPSTAPMPTPSQFERMSMPLPPPQTSPLPSTQRFPRPSLPATLVEAGPSRAFRPRLSDQDQRILQRRQAEAEAMRVAQEAEEQRRAATPDMSSLQRAAVLNGFAYTPLRQLTNGTVANICGIVSDHPKEPKQTRGPDKSFSIIIADPTMHDGGVGSEDLVVTLLRPKESDFPLDIIRGTPILFRSLKITTWNNKLKAQGFSNDRSTWITLRGSEPKYESQSRTSPLPTQDELNRLSLLKRWWGELYPNERNTSGAGGVSMSRRSSGMGFNETRRTSSASFDGGGGGKQGQIPLGEVRPGDFFDGVFKIIHVVHNTASNQPAYELYVADGTLSTYQLRNFHRVPTEVPDRGLFSLAIKDKPDAEIANILAVGNVLFMANIRAKHYRGELELMWSEHATLEQEQAGWTKRRRCMLLDKDDERAKLITRRVNALKRGDTPPSSPLKPVPSPERPSPSNGPATTRESGDKEVQEVALSEYLQTRFTDPVKHPLSTMQQVLNNQTLPNLFRFRARVRSIHPRVPGHQEGLGRDTYVQRHCRKCMRGFQQKWCNSCSDTHLDHAEYRYRFVVVLEDPSPSGSQATVPVLIGDDDAAEFLPALPPLKAFGHNPNDDKQTRVRLMEVCRKVDNILLGPKTDGARPRPNVEWSVMAYVARPPKGMAVMSGQEDGVVVLKVFGMDAGVGVR